MFVIYGKISVPLEFGFQCMLLQSDFGFGFFFRFVLDVVLFFKTDKFDVEKNCVRDAISNGTDTLPY